MPRRQLYRISFSVETPPLGHLSFGAVESEFIWEGRNPFQIMTAHRATLLCVVPCVETYADTEPVGKMPSENIFSDGILYGG
ncbi:TPA: hypothetical protein ACFRHD_001299 [Neisseria lactamica]